MDFRTQDNEMRTSGSAAALSYGAPTHLTKEAEKRRLGNIHNGTPTALSAFTPTHQTLDHHHLQPHLVPTRDPDPDRVGSNPVAPKSKPLTSAAVTATPSNVRYRECLKNHAANIGGNVFDGCGEFMPCGEEGTLEALKCAACDCHRNFHRKEVDGETMTAQFGSRSSRSIMLSPLQLPPPLPSPHHRHHQKFSIVQPMSVAFGGTESSSEDLNVYDNAEGVGGGGGGVVATPYGLSKKRFRTKFTAEQKVKMVEFAERVGWKIQKQDEEDVERFCDEVGVKRQVLRVWMHNNKNTVKKMQQLDHHDITTTTSQLALENNVEAHQQQGGGGQGEGRTDT